MSHKEVKFKIGICGHFAENQEFYDGQTIKTRELIQELNLLIGEEKVKKVDTYMWKKNKINKIFMCYRLVKECENVIILPAANGIKIFLPFFTIVNLFFKRKIHYMVIGGWLPSLIKKNKILKFFLSKINFVYVETIHMMNEFEKMNLKNIYLIKNFKKLNILKVKYLKYQKKSPFKICIFSRITEKKGIKDAVEAIKYINCKFDEIKFILDIYGYIDETYRVEFEKLLDENPNFVNYKGYVEPQESVDILKEYYLLIFPTRFKTEGVPGTIIDAYAAGVPVIASNWDSAIEVIDENRTGFLYEFENINDLKIKLEKSLLDSDKVNEMKVNCLSKAKEYSTALVIKDFLKKYIN